MLLAELADPVHRDERLPLDPRHLAGLDHDVLLEVEDLLELAERHVEELSDAARQPLEEPDVRDRGGELDVAHALPAHTRARDLHSALVTDHTRKFHTLVLPAGALVVF